LLNFGNAQDDTCTNKRTLNGNEFKEIVVRDPYGPLNPLKTEYVANLIREVDFRLSSPDYNDEIEPVNEKKSELQLVMAAQEMFVEKKARKN